MVQLTTQRRPAPTPSTTGATEGWRVRVTADDVRQARDAWLAARDGGAPADRVLDLREDLERLWRAEAYQIAAEAHPVATAPHGLLGDVTGHLEAC